MRNNGIEKMARSGRDYRENERERRNSRNRRSFEFDENENDRFVPIEKYRKPHSRFNSQYDDEDEEEYRKAS